LRIVFRFVPRLFGSPSRICQKIFEATVYRSLSRFDSQSPIHRSLSPPP
jgi:hypothetical protein